MVVRGMALTMLVLLSACGQTGPLYHPPPEPVAPQAIATTR